MAPLLVLLLIIVFLALLGAIEAEWGADSRDVVGDDHQRRLPGGAA